MRREGCRVGSGRSFVGKPVRFRALFERCVSISIIMSPGQSLSLLSTLPKLATPSCPRTTSFWPRIPTVGLPNSCPCPGQESLARQDTAQKCRHVHQRMTLQETALFSPPQCAPDQLRSIRRQVKRHAHKSHGIVDSLDRHDRRSTAFDSLCLADFFCAACANSSCDSNRSPRGLPEAKGGTYDPGVSSEIRRLRMATIIELDGTGCTSLMQAASCCQGCHRNMRYNG